MADTPDTSGVFMEQQDGDGLLLVEGYGGGGFRFLGKRFDGSVLVTETGFFPVSANSVADLSPTDVEELLAGDVKPEILLVGTGDRMALLPAEFRKYLLAQGINGEPMDTGAASRTFNVLRMEDRKVAALLIQVD